MLQPAPKLTRELCHIDWNRPSTAVVNLIRGLSPYPAAFATLRDGDQELQLKIFRAEKMNAVPGVEKTEPGRIYSDGKSYLAVGTADGAVSLKDIQLGGKKRMEIGALLLGFRNPEDWRCA